MTPKAECTEKMELVHQYLGGRQSMPTENALASNDSDCAILVNGLAKTYKGKSAPVRALKSVSFRVPRGQVFCILGPNGAGKTTLLRILTTIMRQSAGTAQIEGFELGRQNIDIRHLIGIVAQDNHFDRYLNAWQNLVTHAQMHGLERNVYEPRIQELMERVGLWERRNDSLEDFSGGMQRRVALIRALLHEPKILFLDEPTTGLDPSARRELWETLEGIKFRTTVILTTHYMEEADRLSDHIIMLNSGEVVMSGTPDELKSRISPPDTFELALRGLHGGFNGSTSPAQLAMAALTHLVQNPVVLDDELLQFRLKTDVSLGNVLGAVPPELFKSIGLAQADLEAVYLTAAAGQKGDAR